MALESYELFRDCRPNAQTGQGMLGIRRFQVRGTAGETVTANSVINNPQVFPRLPQKNESFDFNGFILAVSGFSCSSTPNVSTVEVEISYDDFFFKRREEWGQAYSAEKYPIYVAEPYVSDVTSGGVPVGTNRYVPRIIEFENSQGEILLTVPLEKWTQEERSLVRAQIGKLHQIGDDVFKFIGGSSQYLSLERWEITYRWLADPGFNASEIDLGSPNVIRPRRANPAPGVNELDRLPFEKYLRIPSDFSTQGIAVIPPKIEFVAAPAATPINEVNLPVMEGFILFP